MPPFIRPNKFDTQARLSAQAKVSAPVVVAQAKVASGPAPPVAPGAPNHPRRRGLLF